MSGAPERSWKSHPVTAGLLVAVVMGSIWVAKEVLAGQKAMSTMAKVEAETVVKAHEAPDVAKVHDVSKLMTKEKHIEDIAEAKADRAAIRMEQRLIIQDVGHKLDALVEQVRPGQYRQRRRRR